MRRVPGPEPPARPAVTLLEVIEAFQHDIGQLRQQLNSAERRIAKFDRAFEDMFQKEVEGRLVKKGIAGERTQIAAVEELKWRFLEQQKREAEAAARITHIRIRRPAP